MKVFDLHNDVLTEVKNYKKEILSYSKNCKIITAIYRGNRNFKETVKLINDYKKINSVNTYLAFEDIGYEDLEISRLLSYNPLYCSLTHNKENVFGYGVDTNLPLKKRGYEIIDVLNEYGVSLDIAHLSEKGVYSAINKANRVICSHTTFSGVYKCKRSISDGLIKDIISKKGIVGLCFVGYFLGENTADINSVIKQIDYFLGKFSSDNLCIGSDFNGTDYLPKNLKNYVGLYRLENELKKLGYPSETLNKIFYKNAYNYFFNSSKK